MAHHKSSDPNVFILPDLGEGVHEAELLKWRVSVGQHVNEHDILADMETDKAVVEVPTPREGTIARLHGTEGEILRVGNPLVSYESNGAGSGGGAPSKSDAKDNGSASHAPAARAELDFEVSERSEDAGTVVGQMSGAAAGVSAAPGKALATPAVRRLARDLNVDINQVAGSGIGGRVLEKDVRAAQTQSGGSTRSAPRTAPAARTPAAPSGAGCDMGEPSIPPAPIKAVPPARKPEPARADTKPAQRPAARTDVRVPMRDTRDTRPAPAPAYPPSGYPAPAYPQYQPPQYQPAPYGSYPPPPYYPPYAMPYPAPYPMSYPPAFPPPAYGYGAQPGFAPQSAGIPAAPGYVPASPSKGIPDPAQRGEATPGGEFKVPFRGVRRTIANRLRESIGTAVHFTVVDEADVTDLDVLRRSIAEQTGEKLSFLPFVCAAVCRAIGPGLGGRFGALNARVNDAAEEIVQHGAVHLGIATDTEAGLMVPVIRDADQLDVVSLGREIARVAGAARDRSAPRDMLMGSTFTISNVGSHAGRFATPIINYPEVAIIAVGRVRDAVVVRDGQAVIGKVMPLSLACDHRVVDGATGALALAEIVSLLQDPNVLAG
jgi:pyruvate dehydrogenase E2 component (dihydrolipoamide acetyltransferase)